MTDHAGLSGLDPYDLQDVECARLAAHFGSLEGADWAVPSACAGWSRHDILAHLVAIEAYFSACLDGTVKVLMQRFLDGGAASLADINAAGVAAGANTSSVDLLSRWRSHSEQNRAGFRAADGTDIDSSIGTYPGRAQAFHAAFEYAVHADDIDAPVRSNEVHERERWLAGVARFALTEAKPGIAVEVVQGAYHVTYEGVAAHFDRAAFVAGVAGRAMPSSYTAAAVALLSMGH
jgi:uncharacterized protein (TIGR03083 family)